MSAAESLDDLEHGVMRTVTGRIVPCLMVCTAPDAKPVRAAG